MFFLLLRQPPTSQRCRGIIEISLVQFAVLSLLLLGTIGLTAAQNDEDILNFALNLECLEAAFYSCAAYGQTLPPAYLGELLESTVCMDR